MRFKFGFFVVALLLSVATLSEPVDPKNANEWRSQKSASSLNLSSWPVTRIRQLELLQDKLSEEIALLPRHCPIISDNQLGYHSSFRLNGDGTFPEKHELTFSLEQPVFVQSIALVPAFNPLKPHGGSYAFPKRFKIEAELPGSSERKELVNWINEDYPNPGAYPVFFNDIDLSLEKLIITAPTQIDVLSTAHFALGEVFIWAVDKERGLIENVARTSKTSIYASSSYNQPLKWGIDYLADADTGLGFPIQERQEDRKDLLILPSQNHELEKSVTINIDLGRAVSISRIDLWPAKPDTNIILPDFGFPDTIRVETSDNIHFENATVLHPKSTGDKFGTLFSMSTHSATLRYIRIQTENLQKINGRRIWGLGEIAIYDTAGKLITGSKVSSEGIPKHYNNQLTYLSDGYSWGRKILSERDWMMGLAKRRPLDEQLSYINAELASAHTYWNWLLSRIIIGTLVIIFLVFLGVVLLFQRSQRQQLLVEQGARINRDLHDELGSSLGGITLLADELALMKDNTLLAADLDDLSLMAREANASLREVVWHGVGKDILIGALLQSLFSRAERVVRGVTFKTAMPLNIPEIIVSLSMKRHLTLFFKEVIHNCARHSKATELSLSARCDDGELIIEISDNGGGFDPSKVNDGWGLKNLRARAEEISGNLQIDTELGRGTAVRLQLMLSSLTKEPKYNYQTSN